MGSSSSTESRDPDDQRTDLPGSGSCDNCSPPTQWTQLLDPIKRKTPGFEEALNELLELYRPLIIAYICSRGHDIHGAEDLAHDFIAKLLRLDSLAKVDRAKGRFRSFLYASLKNFLITTDRASKAQKRGDGIQPISIDVQDGVDIPEPISAASDFDRCWAWALLEKAIAEVQQSYEERGDSKRFLDLKGFLPGGKSIISRTELAEKWHTSVNTVDKAIHDMRKRVNKVIRDRVAQTVENPEQLADELKYLITAIGS